MQNKAFTLMELLIVITILAFLMIVAYTPYSLHQKKAKLKIASREISQNFYTAKSMAVSWKKEIRADDPEETENKSIGLFLSTQTERNDRIFFYSFPYAIEENDIQLSVWEIFKNFTLQDWIKINYLSWYDNLLFYFSAITWELTIYTFRNNWTKEAISENKIEIISSYRNASSPVLQRKITYYKNTNIIDYD